MNDGGYLIRPEWIPDLLRVRDMMLAKRIKDSIPTHPNVDLPLVKASRR